LKEKAALARYIVLDWDYQNLHVVSATVKHGQVRLHRAVTFEGVGSPTPADAEAFGKQLRERLKAAGIVPGPVLACVGRDRVIVKEVRYPAVPPHEEPGVVRFQVVKELTESPDSVVIDYAPVTDPAAGGERRAVALVVRRDVLNTYQNLCKGAGLKLQGLAPRSFGTVACLHHLLEKGAVLPTTPVNGHAIAVLALGEPWAEFCVMRGGTLLFTRSLAGGATLTGEVRRNLAVYAGQAPQAPVTAIFVADTGRHIAACQQLRELMAIPVQIFDPFADLPASRAQAVDGVAAERRGAFVGALGLLHALADRRDLPVNFAKPKEPKPPRDPNQRRVLVVAAAAAVALFALVGYGYTRLNERQDRLEKLTEDRNRLDLQLSQYADDGRRVVALNDWQGKDVVWLDELYDLTDRFPETQTMRLTQFSGTTVDYKGKGNTFVGRLDLEGITRSDSRSVDLLVQSLNQDPHYRTSSPLSNVRSTIDRRNFPIKFMTKLDLEKLPPRDFTRRLQPERPRGGPQDNGGGFGGMDFGGMGGFGGGE
jgi:Tfp pilus assembly PilM family ATPase